MIGIGIGNLTYYYSSTLPLHFQMGVILYSYQWRGEQFLELGPNTEYPTIYPPT